jgi:hypothetical protein
MGEGAIGEEGRRENMKERISVGRREIGMCVFRRSFNSWADSSNDFILSSKARRQFSSGRLKSIMLLNFRGRTWNIS